MEIDRDLWLQEKQKRCAHFKKRKLPAAFSKNWQVRRLAEASLLQEFLNKLIHIEETFVIEPQIWRDHLDMNEDILWAIKALESLYQIILSPIENEDYAFSLYLFRGDACGWTIHLRDNLESHKNGLWETLVGNPPTLDAGIKIQMEWFMSQSEGIGICLAQFYRARSYGKAYGYLIAVYSFMENIYHFIHRLHIAEFSRQ
ncbi:hypothetical protein [Methylovulum miyakonense]|uniref:hypothetical protein n=1 Tax=Methylovulum miyakonense TaxID=645578 RepID=UPI00037DE447|nr:hypothetical protein [Methylovulum miyakonense]